MFEVCNISKKIFIKMETEWDMMDYMHYKLSTFQK